MKNKVLLIGWDAADWKVIHELMDAGKMPTLQRMVNEGTMGNLRTLNPPLSPMLWTSIATGKRPYKHGIYGFTEPQPNGNGVQPMTNISRTSKAIWNILNQHNERSLVVGWWPSHPAEPVKGAMVSDFFQKAPAKPGDAWPLQANTIHPPEIFEEVSPLRVHPMELTAEDILPFLPDGAEIDQSNDRRVASVMKVTAECSSIHSAATHLLESQAWDFAAVYYDAIDHYSHGFMRYRAPQQANVSDHDFKMYRHVVDMGYVYHDMMLKQLLEYADDDTTVILISDHGFHPDHLRPAFLPNEPAGPAKEHRDLGIFVAVGPNIKRDHVIHQANLLDITPTILVAKGLPVGEDMDGRPLTDIFVEEPAVDTIESWENVEGESGQHPPGFSVSEEESKAALNQLVLLGYIDPPEKDASEAVANCVRELNYNLARAYMDADLHGKAAPLLIKLYQQFPIEFRYAIQLAACFRVLREDANLKLLLDDLNDRWAKASKVAKERIRELVIVAKERRDHWKELKKLENEADDQDLARIARVNSRGKPILFDSNEKLLIRKLRSVARGNPNSLDILAATVATNEGDFERALELMKRADAEKSHDPALHFHVGIVYISLDRLEDAEASMLKGLEFDPHNPKCLMGLSRCYINMKRTKEAAEVASEAIGLQFHFPVAHYYLGIAEQHLGHYESAIGSLRRAIDQNPNFEEAHEALAKIYTRSVLDENLAITHRIAAKRLAKENLEAKTVEPIDFKVITSDIISQHIPSIQKVSENPDLDTALNQPRTPKSPTEGDLALEEPRPEVVLVSGMPRSGTSMMMQMLAAGGLEVFTDGNRIADASNPKGYYEADLVKGLLKNNKWLRDCDGQVVKVVSPLVQYLPQTVDYKVIYMRRPVAEVVRSQTKMLERLGEQAAEIDDKQMAKVLREQAHFGINLLMLHKNPVLRLSYAEALADPLGAANKINEFLGLELDASAMAAVVDPKLHREKSC